VTSYPADYVATRFISLDLVNHVHKRIETFMYLDDIKPSAVGLDYFESAEIDSKYNLFIADRSHQVPANSLRKIDTRSGFEKISATSFSSSYSDVLITNKTFVDEFNRERPLFYKYKLPEAVVDVQLEVVQVGNSTPVDTGYVVDLDAMAIYTNYQNYFDQDTGNYKLYFVTATMSTGAQERTLLNPESLVSEATWEDIDPDTGDFYTDISVYSKEKNTSGYTYYFNKADTWWIKPQLKSLIRCRPPAGRKSDEAWYIRVSNGDITTIANGAVRRYWLPEYLTQPYQPSFPYIFSPYGKMIYVSDRVISATRGSLAIAPDEGRHASIYIYDYEGNLLKVWTTNESIDGSRYSNTGVYYQSGKIHCWDNQSGLIVLNESILPSWQFFAEYSYAADDLEYTGLNLNPIQNKSLLNQSIVFYIVPNADSDDNGLHYLLVEADGRISYCSQSLGFSYPNLQLRNIDGSLTPDTVIGMKYISDIEDDTFINNFTVGYENSYAYLVLAEVNVLDRSNIDDAYVYDVRVKGNALTESTAETFAKNPKALHSYLGYGEDGAVVPLNNVVVIQAPLDLLKDYGGSLQKIQAEEYLRKYLTAGTYPLIDWTYPWSEVEADVSTSAQVTLSWTWEGPGYLYRVYRKISQSGEWDLLHEDSSATPISFTYVDTDVESNDVVYYEVRIVDSYEYPAPYYTTVKVK
jgi:hypothetical protein